MIRTYENEKPLVPKRKTYDLSSFKGINTTVAEELLPFNYSPKSYNFCFGKGVLDPGYGVENAYLKIGNVTRQIKRRGITVKFVRFFRYTMHNLTQRLDRLVGLGDDGKLYDMALNVTTATFAPVTGTYGNVLDAVPYVYNGDDGLLVSTSTGLYFLRGMVMNRLSFSQVFTTMCVHSDRVFAVLKLDEYKLYFSDDFNPANWQISLKEGGYISFDTEMGKVVKVLSYAGHVYLFFEHGIMRLTAYNLQTEFRLQKLYLSPGTIYKDTVAICGDKIMFAASDGVFVFDGVQIKKTMEEISDLFDADQSYAHAVHHGGKYYLACRLNMDSTIASANNSLVVYDLWRQTVDVAHDLNILSMVSLDFETVRCVLANVAYPSDYIGMITRVGAIDSTPTAKLWQSPVTTLGVTTGKKFLREIRVRTSGSGTLKVWLDGTLKEYALASGLNKVKVMATFDKLRVAVASSAADARVTLAEITVDRYGE